MSAGHSVPFSASSYSKDYDPEDWLEVDGATGWVQTQRVLSPASPFLKDGWYRAIILARDDGEGRACAWAPGPSDPGWASLPLPRGSELALHGADLEGGRWALTEQGADQASPACSLPTLHGHWDPVHRDPGGQ